MMKNINKYSIVFSTLLGVLVGCGGESSSPKHIGDAQTPPRWNQIISQDVNYKIPLAAASTIDLANYTQAINSGANYTLVGLEQIGDRATCTQYQTKETQVVFKMDSAQECYYQYTMQDIESGSTSNAILRVAAGSLQVEQSIKQFSAVTQIDDVVKIKVNDGSTVPEGYVVDEKSIQVLGHGTARLSEISPNVIYYYSGTEQTSQGVHRIMFSYINPDNLSVIQGLIDVAVGLTVDNYAPRAVNFRYGNPASYTKGQQLDYIYVEKGQEVTIDIAQYYNQGFLDSYDKQIALLDDNGSPIYDEQGNQVHYYLRPDRITSTPIYEPGNYLIDRDKDILQVTDVFAYDASVQIVSKDFANTEFTFKSNKEGTHYVTYVLSDHNGGYGTGIIEIKVGQELTGFLPPWDDFLYNQTNRFMAPLTEYEADDRGYSYTTVTEENGVDGPEGWGTPLFDYKTASHICSINGMRLPKLNELTDLQKRFPEGLYDSLDVLNPLISKRQLKVNWPTSAYVWAAAESGMQTTSTVKLDSTFDVKNSIPINSDEQRAVVCVDPGVISRINVLKNNARSLPFGEYNQLEIYVEDHDGNPLPDEQFRFRTTSKNIVLKHDESSMISDSNGRFIVTLGSSINYEDIDSHVLIDFYRDRKQTPKLHFRRANFFVRPTETGICLYDDFDTMVKADKPDKDGCPGSVEFIEGRAGSYYDTVFYDGKHVYRLYREQNGFSYIAAFNDIKSAYNLDLSKSVYNESIRSLHRFGRDVPVSTIPYVTAFYDGDRKVYWILIADKNGQLWQAYKSVENLVFDEDRHTNLITNAPNYNEPYHTVIYSPDGNLHCDTIYGCSNFARSDANGIVRTHIRASLLSSGAAPTSVRDLNTWYTNGAPGVVPTEKFLYIFSNKNE